MCLSTHILVNLFHNQIDFDFSYVNLIKLFFQNNTIRKELF